VSLMVVVWIEKSCQDLLDQGIVVLQLVGPGEDAANGGAEEVTGQREGSTAGIHMRR